jgi:pimeloyl-ACP methyl ester carboxylesterase/plasmid stabilization system protein ParE
MSFVPPKTRYAKSGGVHIAYQVVGDGPVDLVYAPPWIGNMELFWEEPAYVRFLERLASFSRLILFDKRGTGASDRTGPIPLIEQQIDDLTAVLDAVGSRRAALVGASEGGSLCTLFSATHPERTSALILCGAVATLRWSPETPWAPTRETFETWIATVEREWGGPLAFGQFAPSVADDERFRDWWARLLRLAASPATAIELLRMLDAIDVRSVLPTIRVPTLVLHASGDRMVHVENGRYLARHIPNAKYVELASEDHFPYLQGSETILSEIEEFVTGVRQAAEADRVLATVLFTDIVGSTTRAAELGDQRWRDLLERYQTLVRRDLARFRGREVKTLGDGFLAIFDGPARAIRCARAIRDGVRPLGIETRAGLHTGECQLMGEDVGGIAVHIGARVAASASAGEVLVSSTVKELVTGSELAFVDRGAQTLRGVPGEWRLFAVAG